MNFQDTQLKIALQREVPIHLAKIRALYKELDHISGLKSSRIPIRFDYSESVLGSYTQKGREKEEQFTFSLLFIGYGVKNPLSSEDREDLLRHEYAHFMQYNMYIPKEYCWQGGIHGSAWKYCCSLVGAVPTPYYRAGESLMKTNYKKTLENPWKVPSFRTRDIYRREQEAKKEKNSVVHFTVDDEVEHPKFGTGIVEEVTPVAGSVRLTVRFGGEIKKLDQKWLLRSAYKKR